VHQLEIKVLDVVDARCYHEAQSGWQRYGIQNWGFFHNVGTKFIHLQISLLVTSQSELKATA